MDIETAITTISEKIDKSEKYLKGLFTQEKNILNEQFGDSIPDDRKDSLAILKVAKKYGLNKSDLENKKEDDIMEEVEKFEDLDIEDPPLSFNDEEDDEEEEEKVEDDPQSWKEVFKKVPNPFKDVETQFEKLPYLDIVIGPTYFLKLVDPPNNVPRVIEFEGKFGIQNRYPIKVALKKISDTEIYSETYTKGDFTGLPKYVDGQKYTLWLDEKAMGFFKLFWEKLTSDGKPDTRIFAYKKSKKGRFNVYKFSLPN